MKKKNDLARRFQVGFFLIFTLVIPMIFSATFQYWVFLIAIVSAALEWLYSGARFIGLLFWFLPMFYIFSDLFESFPGRITILETVWIVLVYSDSLQLLLGRKFGKIKPFPSISPNKSLEGYLLGTLLALIITVYLHQWTFEPALVVLFAGILGDLYFSFFKRVSGIKDYSTVLGPHGGVCDRLDSVIFALIGLFLWGTYYTSHENRQAFLHGKKFIQEDF